MSLHQPGDARALHRDVWGGGQVASVARCGQGRGRGARIVGIAIPTPLAPPAAAAAYVLVAETVHEGVAEGAVAVSRLWLVVGVGTSGCRETAAPAAPGPGPRVAAELRRQKPLRLRRAAAGSGARWKQGRSGFRGIIYKDLGVLFTVFGKQWTEWAYKGFKGFKFLFTAFGEQDRRDGGWQAMHGMGFGVWFLNNGWSRTSLFKLRQMVD